MKIIYIKHKFDESFDVYVEDKFVMHFDHDTDGWSGMSRIQELIDALASSLGAVVIQQEGGREQE